MIFFIQEIIIINLTSLAMKLISPMEKLFFKKSAFEAATILNAYPLWISLCPSHAVFSVEKA